MSARIKPGDRVRVVNSFPHAMREGDTGSVTDCRGPVVDYRGDNGRMVYGVRSDRFEKVEPVEPEPLKNGEWAQAWVRVVDASVVDGQITVCLPRVEDGHCYFGGAVRISEDAIVRPDAGQVPPWVKPETDPTLPTHADFARACKNLAEALRPAVEAAERAVEQMMRIVREGGAS